MGKKQVTFADIAEYTHFSKTTISRYFNHPDSLGGAYSMIRYRMDRAALGKDPYTNYTFQEILDEGGICMDQAYFAVNTAKCNGIPSAYVTGDGNRGPHAWVNLLTTDETTLLMYMMN